jgi:hypothetical protein
LGEVCKARDTRRGSHRSHRNVHRAVQRRFDRVARAVAALHHRHVCTLYDLAGLPVIECIEGKPLAGALPLDEALR